MIEYNLADCIHPHCLCLDYCEAEDPHSKTPTVGEYWMAEWKNRLKLAEEKLKSAHKDDRKHWRACVAEAKQRIEEIENGHTSKYC